MFLMLQWFVCIDVTCDEGVPNLPYVGHGYTAFQLIFWVSSWCASHNTAVGPRSAILPLRFGTLSISAHQWPMYGIHDMRL